MRRILFFIAFLALMAVPLFSQYDDVPSFEDTVMVYEDLFGIREPLNLTFKFNIKEFNRSKNDEKYHEAVMTCHVDSSFEVQHNVRVRARGKNRRETCSMPPYWLNIRYAGIEAEDLSDVVKMKVVTRCRGSSQYDYYVLREFLIYKIYNLLSPYSFETRLVRLRYIDTGRKNRVTEVWGFIIEPETMMAERNNCIPIKSDKLSLRTVNNEWIDRVAFFSYMVGQSDFSVTGRHNLKILTSKEYGSTGYIPVPYDFDYTGLVNANYAQPGPNLGLTSVRQRYYLGACRSKEIHLQTAQWLASYRDEITELIMDFEYLDEGERLEMVDYLDDYFQEAEGKRFVERNIAPTCR